ncbi:hypothetical protein FNU76_03025 [Chitinimonas arctica]|uniref:Peptidase M12A domain-containing protein n=1 Tax=Chitinimonas arctica TaxID=2594795 RepID=A0A516SB86_9NEIS|nr:M12 family metallopeptidase [Chitinimonas arctica]QDQ25409.1 hypothetical protein FNU76_03025 [Chitinimonas arctica]
MKLKFSALTLLVVTALGAFAQTTNAVGNPELSVPRKPVLATAKLQGSDEQITYRVVDGYALYGDIVLGKHADIQRTGIRPFTVGEWSKPSVNQSHIPSDNHYASASRWPNNTVYYVYDSQLSQAARNAIQAGMKLISDKTAVRFVARSSEPNYVRFFAGGGCYSMVGMQGSAQDISIGSGCEYPGTAAHEMLHALGWMHEQMRPDRDSYVRINEQNVEDWAKGNFTKLRTNQVDTVGSYDYYSVMHYPSWAFSKNGQDTIVPLDSRIDARQMGQRSDLSPGDVASVQKFYPGTTGTIPLKATFSAQQLVVDENVGGSLTLDLAGSDLTGLRFETRSDNQQVVLATGVTVQAGAGVNQRLIKVVPVKDAFGSANVTVKVIARDGKEASATFKLNVIEVKTDGGGTTATKYDAGGKYKHGDVVDLNGKRYTMTLLVNGQPGGTYWIWGSYCNPASCTKDKPFNYGGWLSTYWTPTDGGGTKPPTIPPTTTKCATVLDVARDYQIVQNGSRKSLTPAGDVASAPLLLWQDGGASRWRLQRNADGYYQIASKVGGLAIDVANGVKTAGAEAILWPVTGGENQQWCPQSANGGYQLVARHSGMALGTANTNDGARVVQEALAGAEAWLLSPAADPSRAPSTKKLPQ